ncbi:MAG TPA: ABC transporter ATP-binding protein [Actinomycetota bacterium]|nr:ABC transporter ATP-binding protein [Actinomycetota bacterium]
MLSVRGLHAGYGSTLVLHGVTLEIEAGEIAAVLGPNGAGKTTTLRALSGLIKPARGSVTFEGQELRGRTAEQIVAKGIAHVPENRGVFPALTVEENLRLGGYLVQRRPAEYSANLERVHEFFPVLAERRTQLSGTLSGGEQQMLAIGRGLMSSPKVLLVDEASLGLAPIVVKRLFSIIQQINASGTTVLMVEQNAAFTLAIAHRAFLMQKGQIVFAGSGSELRGEGIVRAYLGEGSIGAPPAAPKAPKAPKAPPAGRTRKR